MAEFFQHHQIHFIFEPLVEWHRQAQSGCRLILFTGQPETHEYDVQRCLNADLTEKLAVAMKDDANDNKAGWIKRLLCSELDKRGIG